MVVDDDDDGDGEQFKNDERSANAESAADVQSSVDVRWWYGAVRVIRGVGPLCVKFVVGLCVCTWGEMEATLTVWEMSRQ